MDGRGERRLWKTRQEKRAGRKMYKAVVVLYNLSASWPLCLVESTSHRMLVPPNVTGKTNKTLVKTLVKVSSLGGSQ